MKIKVSDIRRTAIRLLDYLEKTDRKEFVIDEDFYWMISQEDVYEMKKDPGDLVVGQLTEDWDRLCEILNDENPPVGYAFVWLSSILRRIGEKAVY